MKRNNDVRELAKKNHVFLYEIAEVLHISEPTIMRWLREDLTSERKAEIIRAIDTVAASRAAELAASSAK